MFSRPYTWSKKRRIFYPTVGSDNQSNWKARLSSVMVDTVKAKKKSHQDVMNAVAQVWKGLQVIEFSVEMTAFLIKEGFDKLCEKYRITGVVMVQHRWAKLVEGTHVKFVKNEEEGTSFHATSLAVRPYKCICAFASGRVRYSSQAGCSRQVSVAHNAWSDWVIEIL